MELYNYGTAPVNLAGWTVSDSSGNNATLPAITVPSDQFVILATDADVDGMHIRNLMITYFMKFFEQVVHDGHLYVLETPLFRVRNKHETIYCYSEAERDTASAKLGKSCEITRFKGLGEISPNEFKQFIGKGMKVSQVEYASKTDTASILTFYMGKNTPERKDYIMGNLVVAVEE